MAKKRYWAKGLRRGKQFQVRFSDEEYVTFQERSKGVGIPMVEYARRKILDQPVRKRGRPAASTTPAAPNAA